MSTALPATATIRGELVKITTVRGRWIGALAATLIQPLGALAVAGTGGDAAGDTLTAVAATSSVLGLLGFGAWAAAGASAEYTYDTISVGVVTTPGRLRLLAGKLGALAAVAFAGGLVAAVLSLLLLAATQPPAGRDLGTPLSLLAVPLAYACVAMVGGAVATLVRSPVWSIGIVLAAILLPRAGAGLWGGLQGWVVGASPGTVVTQWAHRTAVLPDQRFPAGTAAATIALVVATLVLGAIAGQVVSRRDGG